MPSDEAKLIVKFEAENKKLHQQLDRTTKRLDRFEKNAKKNVAGVALSFRTLATGAGVYALARFTRKMLDATKTQESAVRQLEQGLASTGNVVGRSLDELTGKAAELQKASTFGDEEIIQAMSQLVTFTNITGDAFDRTTQAVLDLSTRMDQDLKSSVLQLGKALNDPVSNLGALGRAGIQFSDDQKDMIKSLAETNRLAEAQDIILQELERQFGGSAAAARDTLAGALASLDNAFGDLFERSGETDDLTQSVNDLTDLLQDPATVAAVQALTGAIITGFTKATEIITGTVNVVKFLAEEFAAFVHGPALGDLPRLNEQLDELIKKRETLTGRGSGNKNRQDKIAAVDAEIAKTRELIKLSEELAVSSIPKLGAVTGGGPTLSAITVPERKASKELSLDPYKDDIEGVRSLLESIRTPQQVFNDNVRILDSLLQANKISQADYNNALGEYQRRLAEGTGANAQWVADVAAAGEHAEQAKTEIQKLEEQLAELYALAERQPDLIDAQTVEVRAGQIKAQIEDIKKGAEETGDVMTVFAEQAARNIQDKLGDTLRQTMEGSFDGIAAAWGDMIKDLIAQAAAAQLNQYLFGADFATGKSSDVGGLIGKGLGALGSLFGGARADGGPVSAGKSYIVGDGGEPELFTPNTSGYITPMHEMGGSTTNVTINYQGTGDEQKDRRAAGAMAREFARITASSQRYT